MEQQQLQLLSSVQWWISVIAPCLSGAFGVGMTYQLIRSSLKDHEKRITKAELKLEAQVGVPSCEKIREECSSGKQALFASAKADIETVREQMQAEFKDYRQFKGFVEAKLDGR